MLSIGMIDLERFALRQIGDGDFTADDDGVALGEGLAGDARGLILGEAGVEDGVGDGVANLVGMTFADGLRGKNKTTGHRKAGSGFGVQDSDKRVQRV